MGSKFQVKNMKKEEWGVKSNESQFSFYIELWTLNVKLF